MLWRKTVSPLVVPPAAPVPDAERLRQAALQASWQRSRWVARRRVAGRWLLWLLTRYLMPALAVFGLGAWLWLNVLPALGDDPMQRLAQWSGLTTTPADTRATTVPAPVRPAPPAVAAVVEPATGQPPQDSLLSPEGETLVTPLPLKFDARWTGQAPARPAAVPPTAPDHDSSPSPALKPENWLHSKEP